MSTGTTAMHIGASFWAYPAHVHSPVGSFSEAELLDDLAEQHDALPQPSTLLPSRLSGAPVPDSPLGSSSWADAARDAATQPLLMVARAHSAALDGTSGHFFEHWCASWLWLRVHPFGLMGCSCQQGIRRQLPSAACQPAADARACAAEFSPR